MSQSILFDKPISIKFTDKEDIQYSLLMSNIVLTVAGILFWAIIAYLIIKLPNKKQFPWIIFIPIQIGFIFLGIIWWK